MRDAGDISGQLAERIEDLAIHLVGERPSFRSRRQIRFYPKQGLCVEVAGPKRGIWCDHGAGGIGGDPVDLVRHVRGGSLAEAFTWARQWLGTAATVAPAQQPERTTPERDKRDMARHLWCEGQPPARTAVETYLRNRGLQLPDTAVLRFHPRTPRGPERLPAMLALMTDAAGQPCGVHRTYLRADGSGKADGSAKMMLGAAGVIRLAGDVDRALGLAEGIETALAVTQLIEWGPCWAATSAGGISRFSLLPGIECLHAFADADDSGVGLAAARKCADRWVEAGREARIHVPPPGADWLDAMRSQASVG